MVAGGANAAAMLRKLTAFRSLSPEQRHLFLQAYYLLGKMRVAILSRPFKRLVVGLEIHHAAVTQKPLTTAQLASAHQVGWAVRTAASHTPWQSTCLVQVLAAQRMLQQRGIAGAFYLGAARRAENTGQVGLSAHAWLKCNEDFITGEPGHEQYAILSSFTWQ